jgi:alpha-beta hydrolase superfamily lysophospholipase
MERPASRPGHPGASLLRRARTAGAPYRLLLLLLLLAATPAALVACDRGGRAMGAGAQQRPAGSLLEAAAPVPATPQVPPTPVPEPTPVPTPVPEPTPHPLTIAAMRAREYPGSDLVVEQTLGPGSNYNRHVVSYRSEGLKIYALLTVPRGQRPASGWPVVIFNHGYIPPAQYRTTERYEAYVDAFARSGYVVLKADYRGHGSSEGEARSAYGAPDYVVDVLNALAAVRRWPDADPARVGMWGHSMGGYITLRAMVTTDAIKAGVIWAGVVASYPDLLLRWGRPPAAAAGPGPAGAAPGRPPNWRDQLVEAYGGPDENPAFWASISANSLLADLPGPVQLHHGTADTSVPLQFSQTLEQQIRDAGGSVELFVYPGDDHNLAANLPRALARSVAFFDAHVKGRGQR